MKELRLRKADSNDMMTYYEWANDPLVRKESFYSETISPDTHKQWYLSKLSDPASFLYIFESESSPAGQVRIEEKGHKTIIGISVDVKFRGKGLGSQMLKMASGEYWKTRQSPLLAFIKNSNIASVRSFENAGFRYSGSDVVNGSKCLVMKKMMPFCIGNRNIQDDGCFIIAELSANHNQDLDLALKTIRSAAKAGANAIKIQTYTADTITIDCNNKYFQIQQGTLWDGKTLYELYKEAYTPWEWHEQLFKAASDEGLICFSTPFDPTSVDFLEKFNPPAYKIASFEITDIPLIQYIASKKRPLIMSTGIAELEDIELALNTCHNAGNNQIALLKCTSSYPAPLKDANLVTLREMEERYQVTVGLSDHTQGISAPITAVALGARIIEKHFIIDRSSGGPDAAFSLNEEEFGTMVRYIRDAEKTLGGISYQLNEESRKNRNFSRSLFVVKNINAGELFTPENVRSIRPGYGMHPKFLNEVIGKKAKISVERGTPLSWDLII